VKSSRNLLFNKLYEVCVGDQGRTPWLEQCLVNTLYEYSGLTKDQKDNILRLQDLATPTGSFISSDHTASMTVEKARSNLKNMRNRLCDVKQDRTPWLPCKKFYGRAIGHIKH